jgi:hypothetical protein
MNALTDSELLAALDRNDLPALAGHVASSALASAYENRSTDPYYEAAERVDEYEQIRNICGCDLLGRLDERDLEVVGKLSRAMLKSR